jgi:hypothetical protein
MGRLIARKQSQERDAFQVFVSRSRLCSELGDFENSDDEHFQ